MKLSSKEEAIRRHRFDTEESDARMSHPTKKTVRGQKMVREIRRMGRH